MAHGASPATEHTLGEVDDVLASKLDPITPFTDTVSASGTLITPGAGNRLQIRWLYVQAPETNSNTVIVVLSGSTLGDIYTASLEASQPFAHAAVIDLAVNETLDIGIDVAGDVIVNVDFREVTP